MKKYYFFFFIVFFLSVSNTFAWEMANYSDHPADSAEIEKKKADNIEQNTNNEKNKALKRHSLSFEYDLITITDFVIAFASIFDDDISSAGAISIDYGYTFAGCFETGLIFNYALANKPIYTLMPKIKINGNLGGTVNPFFELDLGVTYSSYSKYFLPMGHVTLLGLEIGYPVSLRFQIPFMLWGQRGFTYIGLGYRF